MTQINKDSEPKKLTDDQATEMAAKIVGEVAGRVRVVWADTTRGGAPKASYPNAIQCVDALGVECSHDIFRNRYLINGTNLQGFSGNLTDAATRKLREMSRVALGLDPGKENMNEAMLRKCESRRFHPWQDYLLDLPPWDRVPRLETWLTKYLGVAETPLTRAQGAIVISAIVKRTFEPGAKFDHVLVLEGPEGERKSSICRILANGVFDSNEFFSDSAILDAKDERKEMELTAGVVVYEIAELAGMKRGDQHAIKNFITRQEARARAAYDRYQSVQPRSCIFIGTFNTTEDRQLVEYLNAGDQRRWWPVLVGKIDSDALARDRDQLFAEAMSEYDMFGGRALYLPPNLEQQARGEAKKREKVDPLSDLLSSLYDDVLHMAEEPEGHNYVVKAPDGKSVTRHDRSDGATVLTKGDEATAFAIVWDGGAVWISSKFVAEIAPSNRQNDGGSSIGNAMRRQGWQQKGERPLGGWKSAPTRGWLKKGPAVASSNAVRSPTGSGAVEDLM